MSTTEGTVPTPARELGWSAIDFRREGAPPQLDALELDRLQERLPRLWSRIHGPVPWEHTSVVVPSLSFDPEELAKIQGVAFYEERLLFTLMRLRHPAARVIYVTSQPIHPDIVDYYLQLLVGVTSRHASRRLMLLSVFDASPKPLTQKILERERLIQRIRSQLGDPKRGYLTCFNSTPLEEELAVRLDIPLNSVSSRQLWLGSKSGSKQVFDRAGVRAPAGFENVHSESEMVNALVRLKRQTPELRRAVVKLDESFAGAGNALFQYPDGVSYEEDDLRKALRERPHDFIDWSADGESYAGYLLKIARMGGIVEEFVEGEEVQSPSVQLRINPIGGLELLSTHDQVLGGPLGQEYIGCRFPASDAYREAIQREALKVGAVLREYGVVSRFGVDFLAVRQGSEWTLYAVEINLRMGGTTHPFQALEFLTEGKLDPASGNFFTIRGTSKYYFSTDNLKSPAYRGLLPDDLLEIVTHHGLGYHPATEKGVLFHMIGGISQFGKIGVTCIGDSRAEADELYDWTRRVLDHETGASNERRGRLGRLFDQRLPGME